MEGAVVESTDAVASRKSGRGAASCSTFAALRASASSVLAFNASSLADRSAVATRAISTTSAALRIFGMLTWQTRTFLMYLLGIKLSSLDSVLDERPANGGSHERMSTRKTALAANALSILGIAGRSLGYAGILTT